MAAVAVMTEPVSPESFTHDWDDALHPVFGQLAAPWTTYRLGGRMDVVFFPTSVDQCLAVLATVDAKQLPLTVLGWGSNSIVASAGLRGATLITRKLLAQTQLDATRFELGAGVHLAKIATLAQQHSLTGAEYMIGIPATLGGAVRMNAGALGQETSQVIEQVTLYNRLTQQIEYWPVGRLGYRYRHSALDPDQHVVLSAVIKLSLGQRGAISQRMNDSVAFRKTHHPIEPNGGSVFQNPDKNHTVGQMLDQLQAKGWQQGGMAISPRHANFIINLGHGTSLDLLQLMCRMKQAIKQHYGFNIVPENKLLGDITPEEAQLWANLQATG
jgi:UDP-N-acetylmuramate dehydrogenase